MSIHRIAAFVGVAVAAIVYCEVMTDQKSGGDANVLSPSAASTHGPVLFCVSSCDLASLFHYGK